MNMIFLILSVNFIIKSITETIISLFTKCEKNKKENIPVTPTEADVANWLQQVQSKIIF